MYSIIPNINKTFIQELFSGDNKNIKRSDDRTINEYRQLSIKHLTSSYNSPIEVRLGNTQIFSQINAKLVQPRTERPSEGIISFQVDTHHLKPNADFTSTNEALNEFRISISNILEKCLKESHALDTNILCVIPGKLVWKVILDISVIKHDGNIFDSAIIAALSSWLTYKIPFFRIKEGELYYDSFINLTTIHMPVCVTNGIFLKKNKNEEIMFVLDPTFEEESVMSGSVSICANIFGAISYMHMNTEVQVGLEDIEELMGSTERNVVFIHDEIKKFVEMENKKFDKMVKAMKIIENKGEGENGNNIEENFDNIKKINDLMEIEEKNENVINILEYKK
jgi:exosome complex RNA-binding protein Rrp42 (RNase PH superfamily)